MKLQKLNPDLPDLLQGKLQEVVRHPEILRTWNRAMYHNFYDGGLCEAAGEATRAMVHARVLGLSKQAMSRARELEELVSQDQALQDVEFLNRAGVDAQLFAVLDQDRARTLYTGGSVRVQGMREHDWIVQPADDSKVRIHPGGLELATWLRLNGLAFDRMFVATPTPASERRPRLVDEFKEEAKQVGRAFREFAFGVRGILDEMSRARYMPVVHREYSYAPAVYRDPVLLIAKEGSPALIEIFRWE